MKVFSVTSFFSLLAAVSGSSQGTFVYDQQSSINESPWSYGSGGTMEVFTPPWGQSFTPTSSSVDFLRLNLNDAIVADGLGATVYLNLRSSSITGPIIGTTAPVSVQNSFTGPVTFLFPSSVTLNAGTPYYFEPIVQSGGTWNIALGEYNYAGGSVFEGGVPVTASDLWFREGIVVPEPSSATLLLLGAAAFASFRRSARP